MKDSAAAVNGTPVFTCVRDVKLTPLSHPLNATDDEEDSILYINEEYGATLGSHLWDSSIVLARFMHANKHKLILDPASDHDRGSLAVELGAGLGLAGLWASKYLSHTRVLVTDKVEQRLFVEQNIKLNDCSSAQFAVVDWMDPSCISNLEAEIDAILGSEFTIDLILAADVLYDYEAATLVLSLACQLLERYGKTSQFLVAQKVRDSTAILEEGAQAFEKLITVSSSGKLSCRRIHEEARVFIWSLRMIVE
jgi:predicted nicotinamide N-methyase